MGMNFKINERGEIIREDYSSPIPKKKPKRGNIILIIFLTLVIVALLGLLINNYMQSSSKNAEMQNSYSNLTSNQTLLQETFLTGNIGNSLTVSMYLRNNGDDSYSGWYYYHKNGPNNKLTLQGAVTNGLLWLDEYNASGERTGTLEGVFTENSYKGNLYVYASNKNFDFNLTKSYHENE